MAAKGAASSALKVVVFLGTVRENNMGTRAAKFLVRNLEAKGFGVTLLDPEVLDLPLLRKPLHFYKDRTEAPKVLQDTNKLIEAADCYVIISAEYNNCMPPALTNLVDHFPIASFKYKPTGIVCYSMGSFGGIRAGMQARTLMGEMGAPSIGTVFAISQINKALNAEGEPQDEHSDRLVRGSERLINELQWYAAAIKTHTDKFGKPNL